ncbi:DUF86 domain-containing protein [Proteinivorax hydrogeniformans]|uniref:DUF86 domain-containing protein n=1 Tax=Proteinivorax hydrogeniformans TaxID=1826727 RepID=A0AAU8HRP5_9FIRM
MVNQNLVLTKVAKLKEYLQFLEKVREYGKDKYLGDPFIYGSSERFLHLAIECVIDISNHIISDMGFRKPETNRDSILILYENAIISKELCESLSDMASFRNILVHDYVKLNRVMVYDIINSNLKDLELFNKEVVKLLS